MNRGAKPTRLANRARPKTNKVLNAKQEEPWQDELTDGPKRLE